MKLFYIPGIPGDWSLAPHIVLEWIGAPFELSRIEHGKTSDPNFLTMNLVGKVSALIEENGQILTEVEVILLYLAKKFPEAELGTSSSLRARDEMHQWMSYLTDIQPAFYSYFLPQLRINNKRQYHAVQETAYQQIDACFQILDIYMENRTYMVEDRRTILDPYLFVFCRWGNTLPNPFTDYPNLHRFSMQLAEDEGVQQAMRSQGITI